MKLKIATKICIVFYIVPWLQRALSLAVRAAGQLSGTLDDWAWSSARGLGHDPCPDARKVAWKKIEGE